MLQAWLWLAKWIIIDSTGILRGIIQASTMLLSRFNREMTQNQCFVKIGEDRIEKILTKSQIATLREEWSINLAKMNSTTNEQEVGPKKRLLKYLGNTEDESETGK